MSVPPILPQMSNGALAAATLAKIPVYWGDMDRRPSHHAALHVTSTDLIVVAPVINPIFVFLAWPVVGVIGLLFAGVAGALIGLLAIVATAYLLPRRIVSQRLLGTVRGAEVVRAQGWRRLANRDVVVISFVDGSTWRLAAQGRNQASADGIVDTLRIAGIAVR